VAAFLLTSLAWVPGCGSGTANCVSGLAALRNAQEECPLDPPGYENFLSVEPVKSLMRTPDVVAEEWKKDLNTELAVAKGKFTPYAEALLVAPRAISSETRVPDLYISTLQRVYSERLFGDSGRWIAMITLIRLGDDGAVADSIPIYKDARTSESMKERLFWTYYHASHRAFDDRGEAIWGLAQEILLANPGPPATEEQIRWLGFIRREHNIACLPALTRLYNSYSQMSEQDYAVQYITCNVVVQALARTGGGIAIPLLRKNYEMTSSGFGENCLNAGLELGDPAALTLLIKRVPPELISTKKPKELSENDQFRRFSAIEALDEVCSRLEKSALPCQEKREPRDQGGPSGFAYSDVLVDGFPDEFVKAWARFYEGVMANRVELIARPDADKVTFQVVGFSWKDQ
jgi:hypothetical protein